MSNDDVDATLRRLAQENQKLWMLLELLLTHESGETEEHMQRISIETWSELREEIEKMASSRTDWQAENYPELFLFSGRSRGHQSQPSRRGKNRQTGGRDTTL